MNKLLVSLVATAIPISAQAQFGDQAPDLFSLSSRQLSQTRSDGEDDVADNIFNAEFDEFGNRIVDLTPGATMQTVNYGETRSLVPLAVNLGPEARIKYSPILAMPLNPQELRPSVDVLMRIGTLDLAKPTISYGFNYDSNMNLGADNLSSNQTDSTYSNILGSEIRIESAKDRAQRTKVTLGYRPSWTKYLKYSQLDALNHQALLSIIVPFRRISTGFGSTYSQTETPTLLLGGGGESISQGNTLRINADLGSKLSAVSSATYTITKQEQPLVSTFVNAPETTVTAMDLSGSLSYAMTDRLSFSGGLNFNATRQDGLPGGAVRFGGDLNRLTPTVGASYSPSQKFDITVSAGIARNEQIETGDVVYNPSFQISTSYRPWSSWQIATTFGTATVNAQGIGISTESQTATALVSKTLYREISCALSYSLSNQSSLGNDLIASGIGDITQENYAISFRARTGRNTNVGISFNVASIDAASSLLARDNKTISFRINHQF